MKVKDLKEMLCRYHGLLDVASESLDETLAIACSPKCILEAFGKETLVNLYPDFNPISGATLVLVIA